MLEAWGLLLPSPIGLLYFYCKNLVVVFLLDVLRAEVRERNGLSQQESRVVKREGT